MIFHRNQQIASIYLNKYDTDYINGGLFIAHFLLSYEHTSCALLDPMTDKGIPTMKLFIKAMHSENYCCFFVYNSGDRINWIIGSPYKLL